MRIAHSPNANHADTAGATLVVGNFDGVHVGHRALIDHAKRHARPVGAVTFEPHPRQFFKPDLPPFRLCSAGEKLVRLHSAGCDFVVVLPFDKERASQSALSFVRDTISRDLRAGHVVVGEGFAFGKDRRGSGPLLQRWGAHFGFDVDIVPKLQDRGEHYSSSLARRYLAEGCVGRTAAALGHPWHVPARVNRIHAGLISVELLGGECLLPPPGYYLVAVGSSERGWRNASCRLEADAAAQLNVAHGELDIVIGMTLNLAFLSWLGTRAVERSATVQGACSVSEFTDLSAAMGGW